MRDTASNTLSLTNIDRKIAQSAERDRGRSNSALQDKTFNPTPAASSTSVPKAAYNNIALSEHQCFISQNIHPTRLAYADAKRVQDDAPRMHRAVEATSA